MTQTKRIKREQLRQAIRIHGSLWKLLVALVGIKLARLHIPSAGLRSSLYRTIFSRKYPPGINEDEADRPLGDYASLNAFFTRGLKPGSRPIPDSTTEFLCPC